MEEALNPNFGTAGESKEVFANENLNLTSDLDFSVGEELAIDGQDSYPLASIALDIEHSEAYDTSSSSDIFHVEDSSPSDNSPLSSAIKLDSDFDKLTGESNEVVCNSGFEFEHCATEIALDQAVNETTTLLQEFSQQDDLETKLEEVFGETSNIELAQEILRDIAEEGSLSLPKIEVLDSEILEGADGAYAESTQTIYLSQEFLTDNKYSPDEVTQVLIEEFGHHLDAQINEVDTTGDEGAIFGNIFNLKPSLSAEELAAISIEDDSSTIIVDNELLLVENNIGSYPGYIFKYEEGQSLTYDANVEDWQQAMNDLGWNIAVDGLYGSGSEAAALEFQQQHSDLTNDGIVGENTWNKIRELLDNNTESQPTESTTFSGTADNAEKEILEEREQLLEEKADLESQIESLGTSSPSVTDALQDDLEEVEAQLSELDVDSSEDPADSSTEEAVTEAVDPFVSPALEVLRDDVDAQEAIDEKYFSGRKVTGNVLRGTSYAWNAAQALATIDEHGLASEETVIKAAELAGSSAGAFLGAYCTVGAPACIALFSYAGGEIAGYLTEGVIAVLAKDPVDIHADGHIPAPASSGQSVPEKSAFDNNPDVNNAGVPVNR